MKHGHLDILSLLLENGADANLQGTNGETALSIARRNNQKEAERILLKFSGTWVHLEAEANFHHLPAELKARYINFQSTENDFFDVFYFYKHWYEGGKQFQSTRENTENAPLLSIFNRFRHLRVIWRLDNKTPSYISYYNINKLIH